MVMKFKLKLTIGDKTANVLSCLSGHYVKREIDFDKKLRPSACNGCDWSSICYKIMALIREQVTENYRF